MYKFTLFFVHLNSNKHIKIFEKISEKQNIIKIKCKKLFIVNKCELGNPVQPISKNFIQRGIRMFLKTKILSVGNEKKFRRNFLLGIFEQFGFCLSDFR